MTPISQNQMIKSTMIIDNREPNHPLKKDIQLRELSQKLEATFLSEMLKHAGMGESKSEFSGGVGEDQFASFLRQAQAEEITRAGGVGLAEQLFEALKGAQHGTV